MTRRKELSFEAKLIIWNIAAKLGTANYDAILRAVEREFEKQREEDIVKEGTPDKRKIKLIVEEDLQKLHPDVVIASVPRHIWYLREDYEILKQMVRVEVSEVSNADVENHMDDLAGCAKKIISRLKTLAAEWSEDLHIYEVLVDQNDFDGIELFRSKIAQGLLVHLQSMGGYLSELSGLNSWDDLKIGDIDEDGLNLISLKAALREFEGRCPQCPQIAHIREE